MGQVPGADRERRYESLADAFEDQRTPYDNQRFVRRLLARIDVEGYYGYCDHIRVKRLSGGPSIHIRRGLTNGFRSAEEVLEAIPNASPEPSERSGTWRVSHPDAPHGHDSDGVRRRARRANQSACTECGDVVSLSGVCNNPGCPSFGL